MRQLTVLPCCPPAYRFVLGWNRSPHNIIAHMTKKRAEAKKRYTFSVWGQKQAYAKIK